jgi:Transglutaminase-like superfamily
MRALRRFAELPQHRRRLTLRAAFVVGMVRIGLTVLPFSRLRSILARLQRTRDASAAAQTSVDELAWSVSAVSRYVPRSTCLVQALALELLLERSGRHAVTQIGVARENGRFEAHAWVESEGRRFLEDAEPARFTSLPAGWRG